MEKIKLDEREYQGEMKDKKYMVSASLPGLKANFKDKNKKENTKMDYFI